MAKVKTCIRNILETGVVTIAEGVEDTDFPKWRLWDRNVGDLSKWKTGFTLKINQPTPVAVNAFCLGKGHNLKGSAVTVYYSSDDITYYPADTAFVIDTSDAYVKSFTEQMKKYWKIQVSGFSFEIIASSGLTGYYNSLAFDIWGGAHTVCYNSTSFLLQYSTKAKNGTWSSALIPGTNNALFFTGIAVDTNGFVHIVFYQGSGAQDLKYATNATGTWVVEAIDTAGIVGTYVGIAIDSNNVVHVSYSDDTNGNLKYAWGNAGAWNTHIVDSVNDVGKFTSIAVDSNNVIHIAYRYNTAGDLRYAIGNTTSWTTEDVDTAGLVGEYTSIAIDSNNVVHISYYDASNFDLKHAWGNTGAFTTETLDSLNFIGEYTSIAIDSNNVVHISYYDASNSALKYASNITGSWVYQEVDNTGALGKYTAIACDNENNIGIAYFDENNSDALFVILTLPQLTEMFLTSLYEFERNPSRPCDKDTRFNVERLQEAGGQPRYIKHGEPRAYRLYNLPRMTAAQSTNIQALNDAWDGCKPFFLCDHNGVWLFGELLGPIGLAEESSNRDSCTLEFQEIPA